MQGKQWPRLAFVLGFAMIVGPILCAMGWGDIMVLGWIVVAIVLILIGVFGGDGP